MFEIRRLRKKLEDHMTTSHVSRPSIIGGTRDTLRRMIEAGEFADGFLPAQRPLSEQLGVSRPSLRAALRILESEGWLRTEGRRRRVRPSKKSSAKKRRVVFLRGPAGKLGYPVEYYEILNSVIEHFQSSEIEVHMETLVDQETAHSERTLESLVRNRQADLWLINRATPDMLEWFWRRELRCFVLGTTVEGIDLPFIDEDYRATCRHAAGLLITRGHRSLAFLLRPETRLLSQRAAREGFDEGVRQSTTPGLRSLHCEYEESVAGIGAAVDRLLAHPDRPDGWLIAEAEAYVTVATHLARRGRQIGKDISLVCRRADPVFNLMVPSVACYRRDTRRWKNYLNRQIPRLLDDTHLSRHNKLLPSEWVPGESVRECSG